MATRKPAAKKAAPAKRPASAKPSPAARIDALELQVAGLAGQVENLARFIAAGVAQQLQAQLMESPELRAVMAQQQDQPQG